MMTIRVLIAEPNPQLRRQLLGLLDTQNDLRVVFEAADGREALLAVERLRPQVIVLSDVLTNPGAVKVMKAVQPSAQIIVMATYHESVLPAFAAGADACIHRDSGTQQVVDAIRLAAVEGAEFDFPIAEEEIDTDSAPGPWVD